MKTPFDGLLEAGSAVIADVFDALDRTPLVLDNTILAITEEAQRFVGPAYTIDGRTLQWKGGGDRGKLEAVDCMPQGVVAVWAGNDIQGVCCFGDLLATAMKARGALGVVVDGGVRDTGMISTLGLPVKARYRTPAQAIGRWQVRERQVPVRVRGALEEWVTIRPNDVVVSDEDGIVIVPAFLLNVILERTSRWIASDASAREDIAKGLRLLEALEKYGHL